jgi:type I restriction enzyme S subunit
MTMTVPPAVVQSSLDTIIEPVIRMQAHLASESRKLAALRDYLLPKLLSGQVRVREAETTVAKAV